MNRTGDMCDCYYFALVILWIPSQDLVLCIGDLPTKDFLRSHL